MAFIIVSIDSMIDVIDIVIKCVAMIFAMVIEYCCYYYCKYCYYKCCC